MSTKNEESRIRATVPRDLWTQVKIYALANGLNVNEVVVSALQDFINVHKTDSSTSSGKPSKI